MKFTLLAWAIHIAIEAIRTRPAAPESSEAGASGPAD